ncbi:MAG: hypothetical protein SFX72_16545 [Isosphaeraceae bacterium]|nr:hypothetical protein [Isosphaeraceae bacterium]
MFGIRGALTAVLVSSACLPAVAPAQMEYDREPIRYSTSTADDAISRLQSKLRKGEVELEFDESGSGWLASILRELRVPESSQTLVFSKTSFQHTRIAPRTPRAIYFNDDVYVGFVKHGDVLEFAAVDPKLGATFYILDQQPDKRPRFLRQTETCLQCHASSRTRDVPGHLIRSVFPDRSGLPVYNAGSFTTDHESPFSERWGGWYVTGTHGAQRHMGNAIVEDRDHPEGFDREAGANRVDLEGLVDTSPYRTRHSDLVALLVLEHQTQMHNLITHAGYQGRMARTYDEGLNKAFGRPLDVVSESSERRIQSAAEKVVAYMLFSGEPKLAEPVSGTSGFARDYSAQGPSDRRGRSLRELDLKTRLLRYPCSPLIYSDAFEGLPDPVKSRIYTRLHEILTGKDRSPAFEHLSDEDRRAILEILLETKSTLPAEWSALSARR